MLHPAEPTAPIGAETEATMFVPAKFPSVSSSAARELYDELDWAARYGNDLTAARLHTAINTFTTSVTGSSYSVGIDFLQTHREVLRSVVPIDDRLAFLMQHLDNPAIVEVIGENGFLECVPADQRVLFLKQLFVRYPMPNASWLRDVAFNISSADLTDMVMVQLQDGSFSDAALRPFVTSLVLQGAGLLSESLHARCGLSDELLQTDSRSTWAVLDRDRLFDVMHLCARRCPEVFFAPEDEHGHTVVDKLSSLQGGYRSPYRQTTPPPNFTRAQVKTLLTEASQRLKSLEGLPLRSLQQLPAEARRALASRGLPGSIVFLAQVTLVDPSARRLFAAHYQQCMPTNRMVLLEAYRRLYPLFEQARYDGRLDAVGEIDEVFTNYLRSYGFFVGVLKRTWSERHGDQGSLRAKLDGRMVKFVTRRGHKWYPANTAVIVDTKAAENQPRNPGATIVPVTFIPHNAEVEW